MGRLSAHRSGLFLGSRVSAGSVGNDRLANIISNKQQRSPYRRIQRASRRRIRQLSLPDTSQKTPANISSCKLHTNGAVVLYMHWIVLCAKAEPTTPLQVRPPRPLSLITPHGVAINYCRRAKRKPQGWPDPRAGGLCRSDFAQWNACYPTKI